MAAARPSPSVRPELDQLPTWAPACSLAAITRWAQHRIHDGLTTPLKWLVMASRSGSVEFRGCCLHQAPRRLTVEELERHAAAGRVGLPGPLRVSAVTMRQLARRSNNHAGPRWPWRFSCTAAAGIGGDGASLAVLIVNRLTGGNRRKRHHENQVRTSGPKRLAWLSLWLWCGSRRRGGDDQSTLAAVLNYEQAGQGSEMQQRRLSRKRVSIEAESGASSPATSPGISARTSSGTRTSKDALHQRFDSRTDGR